MKELLHFLLQLCGLAFKAIFAEISRRIFVRTFLKSNSRFYYKRLIELLRIKAFEIKVAIFLTLYGILLELGLIKPPTKEQNNFTIALAVLIVIAIAFAAYITTGGDDRKKKVLVT